MNNTIPVITLIVISIFYLLIVTVTVIRRGWREYTTRLLLLFLGTSVIWELLHAMSKIILLFLPDNKLLTQLPVQGVLLMAFIYFHLSRSFLRLKETDRDWWRLGVALMVTVLFLQGIIFLVVSEGLPMGNWILSCQQLQLTVLVLGWASFSSGVALLTLRSYRQMSGPLHRNRIKYWLLALCFILLGDAMFFAEHDIIGSGIRLAASLLISYAMLTYNLFDVSQMMRHLLNYLIIALLTVFFYLISFITVQYIFGALLDYNPLMPAVAAALMLAVLFNPLLGFVQRLVDHLVLGQSYNANLLVRQYSTSISNILKLDHLAFIALNIIQRTMQIQYGTLFLVSPGKNDQAQNCFHLQEVSLPGDKRAHVRTSDLLTNSPITTYLKRKRYPLTQYEIDMLPRFENLSLAERNWLISLKAELYVPIYAKNKWIGLLVLGPKISHKAYHDNDLALLSTLADQTAVALQNALLVEDLVKLNKDLNQAYQKLDKVNLQLKELDQLKSAFIGVITHELRSPFINIDLSMELIDHYGTDCLELEQYQQWEQLKSNAKYAKQMVDNLVNFATFLSNRTELYLMEIDAPKLIDEVIIALKPQAVKKQIILQVDNPPKLPPISGDPQRLKDAIYHLIDNAVKFTPIGGRVLVRCRPLVGAVRFEVEDNGVGVSADQLPLLWEEFAQISDPLRRGIEGLGLGLTLVKYVANAHGGEVFAQSKVGVGSTFGFQIPSNYKDAK